MIIVIDTSLSSTVVNFADRAFTSVYHYHYYQSNIIIIINSLCYLYYLVVHDSVGKYCKNCKYFNDYYLVVHDGVDKHSDTVFGEDLREIIWYVPKGDTFFSKCSSHITYWRGSEGEYLIRSKRYFFSNHITPLRRRGKEKISSFKTKRRGRLHK